MNISYKLKSNYLKITFICGLFFLSIIASTVASAVGLGNIRLYSDLNYPFLAEISLTNVDSNIMRNLEISLASEESFIEVGIPKEEYLSNFKFELINLNRRFSDNNGEYIIKVYTNQPITEPIIEFILELSWDTGKIMRAYSVILSPATKESIAKNKYRKMFYESLAIQDYNPIQNLQGQFPQPSVIIPFQGEVESSQYIASPPVLESIPDVELLGNVEKIEYLPIKEEIKEAVKLEKPITDIKDKIVEKSSKIIEKPKKKIRPIIISEKNTYQSVFSKYWLEFVILLAVLLSLVIIIIFRRKKRSNKDLKTTDTIENDTIKLDSNVDIDMDIDDLDLSELDDNKDLDLREQKALTTTELLENEEVRLKLSLAENYLDSGDLKAARDILTPLLNKTEGEQHLRVQELLNVINKGGKKID